VRALCIFERAKSNVESCCFPLSYLAEQVRPNAPPLTCAPPLMSGLQYVLVSLKPLICEVVSVFFVYAELNSKRELCHWTRSLLFASRGLPRESCTDCPCALNSFSDSPETFCCKTTLICHAVLSFVHMNHQRSLQGTGSR